MSAPIANQTTDEIVVAAVDVVHTADDRFAVGRQTGNDQRGTGADVGSAHRRAAQSLDAAHHRVMTIGADVGTKPLQLLDIAEPARVEVLGDDADAVGHRQHRDDQRLVVGGDARVRQASPHRSSATARGPTPPSPSPTDVTVTPMSSNRRTSISM